MQFKNTRVIYNPAAHSGTTNITQESLEKAFAPYKDSFRSLEFVKTTGPGCAKHLARQAADVDSLFIVGGDGVLHETVAGLMELTPNVRPTLGLIPMGSGNDFAKTANIVSKNPAGALAQLVQGQARAIDLVRVRSNANEINYMVETLSFGLDAAIALDTTKRRAQNTKERGRALFISSGFKIFSTYSRGFSLSVNFEDTKPLQLNSIVFAVQNGPTYGGGFRICPRATPFDGLLDVCYNVQQPSIPHTLALFVRARFGKHTKSPVLAFKQVHSLHLVCEKSTPKQIDGEELLGTEFWIDVLPHELEFYLPMQKK